VVSTLLWALANSVVGGLVSAWATDSGLIKSYNAAEETVLRSAMFSETAMMAGVATARVGENLVSFLIGLAGGILVGGIISWFVFAMVYATMNVVVTIVRNE
jgi:hypothetical protein